MKTLPTDNELHELFGGRLKIFQHKHGYRFSIDSILLAGFAAQRAAGTVVDLGTGSGILAVVLARHAKFNKITAIEIQQDLAALARRNVLYNKCGDKVNIVNADIKKVASDFSAGEFETAITNPPFYPAGSGRINPDRQNAIARHELRGTLYDFICCAAFLLKQGGKFMVVYPSARIVDLIAEMRHAGIEPKALQFIHSRMDGPATLVLAEGVKGAGTEATTLAPLILYDDAGNYTEQARAIFNGI